MCVSYIVVFDIDVPGPQQLFHNSKVLSILPDQFPRPNPCTFDGRDGLAKTADFDLTRTFAGNSDPFSCLFTISLIHLSCSLSVYFRFLSLSSMLIRTLRGQLCALSGSSS